MEESVNPTITLGPVTFDLTLLAMSLLTVLIVFAFVYWASRKMTLKPSGKQNVLEYLYDFVIGFTKGNIGDKYMKKALRLGELLDSEEDLKERLRGIIEWKNLLIERGSCI